ncbi:hypothetical protein [Bradyrhizobium sp. CCGB20]|uniref:hypothetical protein n=1 Tax=Bradyrhizobium sp. CCGB20 TaxID=2949633 RepID=UPI0020B3510D|nr:hypothetical protein [Bradyrhizobium sp. CCGB20]MCP3401528.1 hypothetical protein [Bradyrhizobium sp. CCGB20]
MSTNRQQPHQPRIEPDRQESGIAEPTGWPRWIADALAYKPQNQPLKPGSPGEAAASESTERRNIRVLRRVLRT